MKNLFQSCVETREMVPPEDVEKLSREVSKSNIPQELSVAEKDENKEMLFMMYCYMYINQILIEERILEGEDYTLSGKALHNDIICMIDEALLDLSVVPEEIVRFLSKTYVSNVIKHSKLGSDTYNK